MSGFPFVTVAVCTMDRPEALEACLTSLNPVRSSFSELLIIDESSRTTTTEDVAMSFGARYIKESRAGISAAMNSAVLNATGEIIAFTNDDCQVDPKWLSIILENFSDPRVACVVGKAVAPGEANRIQKAFDTHGLRVWKIKPFRIERERVGEIYYRAVVGIGANMAFRRDVLLEIGGFDERLRACGDDDYIFCKLVSAGFAIQYDPRSVVYQQHRNRLVPNLFRLHQYGVGAMDMIWLLSVESRNIRLFALNVAWVLTVNLVSPLRDLFRYRMIHFLFGCALFSGVILGLFICPRLLLRPRGRRISLAIQR